MRIRLSKSKIKSYLTKVIAVFVLLLIILFLALGIKTYRDINTVWENRSSWKNPVLVLPKYIKSYKIKITPINDTQLKYEINYALLYKTNVSDETISYSFSLATWSPELTKYTVANLEGINYLKPDIVLKVPIKLRPSKFLKRKLISTNDWTILKSQNNPEVIPVRFSAIMSLNKPSGFRNKLKHYIKFKYQKKQENYIAKLKSWGVDFYPEKLNLSQVEIAKAFMESYINNSALKKLRDDKYYATLLKDREQLYRFWKDLEETFGTYGYTCMPEMGCQKDAYTNPTRQYIWAMYALAYYDENLFDRLYVVSKKFLKNFDNRAPVGPEDKLAVKVGNRWTVAALYGDNACPFVDWEKGYKNEKVYQMLGNVVFKIRSLQNNQIYTIKVKKCNSSNKTYAIKNVYTNTDLNCYLSKYNKLNRELRLYNEAKTEISPCYISSVANYLKKQFHQINGLQFNYVIHGYRFIFPQKVQILNTLPMKNSRVIKFQILDSLKWSYVILSSKK